MRVIGGSYRSRRLVAPPGADTRPTSDRLRETLFNILGPRVTGARFLDLYCGTGAVGIEALSRGAAHVLFVERALPAIKALRENLRSLGITAAEAEVMERPVRAALASLAKQRTPKAFDLVFLDPPYEWLDEYAQTLALFGSDQGQSLLDSEALVIAEHATRDALPEIVGRLRRVRTLRQGDATLSFFAVSDPAEPVSE